MKKWLSLGLVAGIIGVAVLAVALIWQPIATSDSLNNALLILDEQREVLTGGALRRAENEAGQPIKQPIQLTVAGILAETNRHRAEAGLSPLTLNPTLNQAAHNKVADMFLNQYFEHISPNGIGPADIVDAVGYEYVRVGENLALGNYEDDTALVQAWMDSPGHRENILKPNFSEIGIAASSGRFEASQTWLAVQEFGLPLSSCPGVDPTLQQQIDAEQAALLEKGDSIKSRTTEIERERSSLERLAADISQLVAAGNAKIKQGNKVAQEQGNEAAQPYWDAGNTLHQQAKEQQAAYDIRQEKFNPQISDYNEKVAAQRKDSAMLESLVQKVNNQIRAFNNCLER